MHTLFKNGDVFSILAITECKITAPANKKMTHMDYHITFHSSIDNEHQVLQDKPLKKSNCAWFSF